MFKSKLLIIFVILLCPLHLFSQSGKTEKTFSIGFQVGYLFPQNTGGSTYSSLVPGLEYRPSIHYKLSKTVSSVLEYSYSKLKYELKERENLSVTFQSINLGLRVYPKIDESIYLKPAFSFSIHEKLALFPNINIGTGAEIRISKSIGLFGEADVKFSLSSEYMFSFLLSAGLNYKIF